MTTIDEATSYINSATTPEERAFRKREMHMILYCASDVQITIDFWNELIRLNWPPWYLRVYYWLRHGGPQWRTWWLHELQYRQYKVQKKALQAFTSCKTQEVPDEN